VIRGVDYTPRPIGDGPSLEPASDYFWGDPSAAPARLTWLRDVWGTTYNTAQLSLPPGLVRQLGANSIRTYAWWKFAPTSAAVYAEWPRLDWSVGPEVRYGMSAAPSGFARFPAHDGGDQFLDLCWNHGVDPIYVVIGITIDPWLGFPSTNAKQPRWQDVQAFTARTAEWLARRYGYHPAVLGFCIGNETNLAGVVGTDRYLEYWRYLNSLAAIVKRYAPDKLTMTAFADYPRGRLSIVTTPLVEYADQSNPHRGAPTVPVCVDYDGANPGPDCGSPARRRAFAPDVYQLDVWGFNSYRTPETGDLAGFKDLVIDGRYTAAQADGSVPANPEPKPLVLTEWGAPVSIRTRSGLPPKPPNPDWVAVDPGVAGQFKGAPGYNAARLIQQLAMDMYGPRSTLSTANGGILSGGYLFEFSDEWWKEDVHHPGDWCKHNAGTNADKFTWGEPPAQFKSYWDEEWFGLLEISRGGVPHDDSCSTSLDRRGAPPGARAADTLKPRAGFYALQKVLLATKPAATPPSGLPHIQFISSQVR